jgi:DNA-binding GntR family transcriptional regulator
MTAGILLRVAQPHEKRQRPSSAPRPGQARRYPGRTKDARVSRVDQAYEEIRRRIVNNEYPPAHQVLEHELAAELAMSRTPVREALIRLENEKFVQIIPRHGMRVVPLSLNDLRDVYEVLTALELTAIERLARSETHQTSTAALDHALNDMDKALKKRDVDGWVKADERFHRTVLDLCGNARLASMAFMLWDQGHRARLTTVRLRPALETSNREHRAVVDAVRRGDWREAVARHAKHRARTSREIITLLEQCRLGIL